MELGHTSAQLALLVDPVRSPMRRTKRLAAVSASAADVTFASVSQRVLEANVKSETALRN
jgi:hypothetical protein